MIALLVVAATLLLLPLYLAPLAVVRVLDAARLRVGPRRARAQTQAAPAAPADAAQSYTTPHPHALGTWGTGDS